MIDEIENSSKVVGRDEIDALSTVVSPSPSRRTNTQASLKQFYGGNEPKASMRAATDKDQGRLITGPMVGRPEVLHHDPSDPLGFAKELAEKEGGVKGFARGNVAAGVEPGNILLGILTGEVGPLARALSSAAAAKKGATAFQAAKTGLKAQKTTNRVVQGAGGAVGGYTFGKQSVEKFKEGDVSGGLAAGGAALLSGLLTKKAVTGGKKNATQKGQQPQGGVGEHQNRDVGGKTTTTSGRDRFGNSTTVGEEIIPDAGVAKAAAKTEAKVAAGAGKVGPGNAEAPKRRYEILGSQGKVISETESDAMVSSAIAKGFKVRPVEPAPAPVAKLGADSAASVQPIQSRAAQPPPTLTKTLTGARNAVTEAERAERGMSPVQRQAYTNIGEAYNAGRAKVDSGKVDARVLAQEVASKPRTLSADEVGALGYDRARLIEEDRAISKLAEATDDPAQLADLRTRREKIQELYDLNDQALVKGGREQSAAFNARKLEIADDFSPVAMKQRMKVAKGAPLTPEENAKIEQLSRDLEAAHSEIAELRTQKSAESIVEDINREVGIETRRLGRKATKEQIEKEYSDLIGEFVSKSTKLSAGIDPELFPLVGRIAKNRVRAGVVTVEGLVDELWTALSPHMEGLTRRDIRDAISGYGQTPKPLSEEARKLSELRSTMRLISKLEDAQAGQAPAKGVKPHVTEQNRQLMRDLESFLKQQGLEEPRAPRKAAIRRPLTDAQLLANAKARATKSISDIERKIANRDFSKRQLRRTVPDKDLEAAQERLLGLRKQFRHMERQAGKTQVQRFSDAASFYQKANLLSGPAGAIRDVFSTAFHQNVTNLIARPAEAVFSKDKFVKEAGAATQGWVVGMRKGFKEAAHVLKHGITEEDVKRFDFPESEELPGGAKNPWNMVVRLRSALNAIQTEQAGMSERYALAYRQARKEGLTGETFKTRMRDLIENPTPEMETRVHEVQKRETFTEDEDTVLRGMYALRRVPGGKFVVPFMKTTYNLTKQGLEMTPAGFIKAARAPKGEKTSATVRAAIGTGAMAALAPYALEGNMTGPMPSDDLERLKFIRSGKKPYSIKIGNKWVEYRNFGAAAVPLALVGGLGARYKAQGENEKDHSNAVDKVAGVLSDVLQDGTALQGLSIEMDAILSGNTEKFLGNTASGFVPGISLQRNLTTAYDDWKRDPQTWYDWVLSDSFYRTRLPIKEAKTVGPLPNENQGVNAFSPVRTYPFKNEPPAAKSQKTRTSSTSRRTTRRTLR